MAPSLRGLSRGQRDWGSVLTASHLSYDTPSDPAVAGPSPFTQEKRWCGERFIKYIKYIKYIWFLRKKRFTMYMGDTMKKTEYITFRTDQFTKMNLEKIAAERKWTISQLAEEIIKEFVHKNGEIGNSKMVQQHE